MSSPTSILSQTLQSITLTKIRELEKQRNTYETRKNQILADADRCDSQRDRLALLLSGVNELLYSSSSSKDPTISNIERWLDQSRYDTSIPKHLLQSFEEQLRAKLAIQSRKLTLADLYSRLLTEWMNPPALSVSSQSEEDSFELVERQKQRLQELCDQFEAVVFEPLETDEAEIHEFMRSLFPDAESIKALENLRKKINDESTSILTEEAPFTEDSLTKCIKGLLTENILSDEKQAILRDFLQNKVALAEIADVLNMRYADIKNWDWHAGDKGIPVIPRQQLNGKYRIWMDEDVLQTIFVQYIGIRLCMLLKAVLRGFINDESVWNWASGARITQGDIDRRRYYLATSWKSSANVEAERKESYISTFFLSQLPTTESSLYESGGGYDNDDGDDDDDDDDDDDNGNPKSNGSTSIKQKLLRKLATEVLLHRHLRGEVAVVQSDLKWYATGLPHSTIFAVMRFVGFPEEWIQFFKKYLESPLNMDRSSDDRVPVGPRIRKRGVPMAHSSEKFLGELVLFVLDLAVNRETGMLLYRLHDDLWLCGEPKKCARAWEVMHRFARVMGLEYNQSKTGSVYLTKDKRDSKVVSVLPKGPVTIGFLTLDAESGEWTIDHAQVDAHVQQLQKQLNACDSVLSWVRTWNSCIGRFFSHTFGEPAFCFGRRHVDAILETYERMQRTLFGGYGTTVTEHLRRMIRSRFDGVSDDDIPDAFFFLPEELGGLGLRNPFVPLFLVRNNLDKEKSPEERLADFLAREREAYQTKKKQFDELSESARRRRFMAFFPNEDIHKARDVDPDTFMSLDEFSRFRESVSQDLHSLYLSLMSMPPTEDIHLTREVRHALDQLKSTTGQIATAKKMMASATKWILQMYAGEMFERCGGLSLVEKRYLPTGVLAMMRGKKVTWQMVL